MGSDNDKKKQLNPKTTSYEFGGPIGAAFITISLPLVVLGLYALCTPSYCFTWSTPNPLAHLPLSQKEEGEESILISLLNAIPWSWNALGVVTAWIGFQVLLERFLPCTMTQGVQLRNGKRLQYIVNSHLAFWLSILLTVIYAAVPYVYTDSKREENFVLPSLSWVYDHYAELATASIAISFVLSVYLYVTSFSKDALLAEGGNSGNPIYDFYIGRELNPRIGQTFDLKYFCELRPGLIGWTVINIALLVKQMEMRESGLPSLSMIAVVLFQTLYVWDAQNSESAILTTMDITTDGFGFMLAFGDLVWVPFTYTLQARFLVLHDPELPIYAIAGIVLLNALGYLIFRGANGEKDKFRTNPDSCPHLKWMPTKRGTKLITSGWWGMARKINYTGDWIMALSWCMVTGFSSILPYFYAIYFAVLLIHRALRDDHACSLKYGDDWKVYKQKVPYLFIPKLF